ncbi:MAG: ABC transporter ATP-binding protein/permease, partial [Butyrivibrio sp.]|nr:ABC transporter ATP-binding protein/permease [Butyrivibrio sp.]
MRKCITDNEEYYRCIGDPELPCNADAYWTSGADDGDNRSGSRGSLFSGDIADNLNFGNERGGEQEWKEAASIACADEFVNKKDGIYHAPVSQGGTNFSGGQRQRLAIARAVMKKAEVYIFDDSFSALDMKTDKTLRQNIKKNMKDSTTLVGVLVMLTLPGKKGEE